MKAFITKNKTRLLAFVTALIMLALTTLTVIMVIMFTAPKMPSVAVDGDGNDYDSTQYYDLPNNLIFTKSETTDSVASVNLQATIKPDTATNKQLTWTATFLNNEAEWASGKSINDYITITVDETDKTKATITCLQAFGEKININVVSVDNPNAKANCTLDYAQKIIGVELYFGDWKMNMETNGEGVTEFKFNVNPNGASIGGTVRCNYIYSDAYTLADNYNYKVKPHEYCPRREFNSNTCGQCLSFSLNDKILLTTFPLNSIMPNPSRPLERDDFIIENTTLFTMVGDFDNDGTIGEDFNKFSKAQQIEYLSNISQPFLCTLELIIEGQYSTYTTYTDLKCIGYIDYAAVSEIGFPNSNVVI